MMSIFLMTGIISSEVLAQVPNSSRSSATNRSNASAVTKSNNTTQQSRQVRKGDTQLSRANSSYQKAQQNVSKPATSNVNTSKQVPTNRPSANSSATRPTTSNVNTSKQVPTNRLSTNSSTTRPAVTSTTAREPVGTPRTVAEQSATRRGYTEQGKAQPQPVATGPRNEGNSSMNNDDRGKGHGKPGHHHGTPHTPYVHPNHHNYNGHMYIPPRIRPVYYHGVPYYFYNSVYCRYINGHYIICRPPLGAVIAYAIFNTWKPVIVIHKNVNYYYDDGTFYLPYNNNYKVVAPPIGARVAELPSNYEEIILDNTLYYKVDNVYYKAVVVSGYIWYEVVFVS